MSINLKCFDFSWLLHEVWCPLCLKTKVPQPFQVFGPKPPHPSPGCSICVFTGFIHRTVVDRHLGGWQ
ncbi:hypothetical protein FKM82_001306 [Ascaphus truei]